MRRTVTILTALTVMVSAFLPVQAAETSLSEENADEILAGTAADAYPFVTGTGSAEETAGSASQSAAIYAVSGANQSSYFTVCQALDAGQSYTTSSREDAAALLSYYNDYYDLESSNCGAAALSVLTKRQEDDSLLYTIETNTKDASYQEEVADAVIAAFGIETLGSARETIEATYERVEEKLDYSYTGARFRLTQSIETGLAVCDQYSKIAAILLNAEGVPTMVVHGRLYSDDESGSHAWNRCLVDGSWITVDFSSESGIFQTPTDGLYIREDDKDLVDYMLQAQ